MVQFGKIVRVETDAGLKYKVPFVESVVKYSKKVQSWDGDAQRIPTSENQFIWVDTTARWRISDPKKFYESVGSMTQAQGRLDDVIDSEVRKIISKNPLREAVRDSNVISQIKRTNALASVAGSAESSAALSNISTLAEIQYEPITVGRRALSIQMLNEARTIMPQYGMELIDVIIRQIKYSDDLTPSVYDRMIKERNQIAQAFRSDGEGEKAKWLGQTTRELLQIQSDAEKKGEGDQGEGGRGGAGHPQQGLQPGPGVCRLLDGAGGVQDAPAEVQQDAEHRLGFLQVPVQQEGAVRRIPVPARGGLSYLAEARVQLRRITQLRGKALENLQHRGELPRIFAVRELVEKLQHLTHKPPSLGAILLRSRDADKDFDLLFHVGHLARGETLDETVSLGGFQVRRARPRGKPPVMPHGKQAGPFRRFQDDPFGYRAE